jgi:hypothetical protein
MTVVSPTAWKVLVVCDERLQPAHRRIAAQLAEHMNEAGRATVTTDELAAQCGCRTRDAVDAVIWLKRWGWLIRDERGWLALQSLSGTKR